MRSVVQSGWLARCLDGSGDDGEWSLVGTTMAPAVRPGWFRRRRPEELQAIYPDVAEDIARLTRWE